MYKYKQKRGVSTPENKEHDTSFPYPIPKLQKITQKHYKI